MTNAIAIPAERERERDELSVLAQMAVQSLGSPSSRRNYARSIRLFLASSYGLTREGVLAYLRQLERQRKGPVTRNVALAAIRLLAVEANVRGLLPNVELAAIDRIRGAKLSGVRTGNWLSGEQVTALLYVAIGRRDGVRDAALVACMVGCGLRRAEVCTLEWSQWQLRDGRWVWVDVRGKGGRVRSAAAPDWAAERIAAWWPFKLEEDGIKTPYRGRVFELTPQSAFRIVRDCAHAISIECRPHDLRRTWARLAREGGAPIEQIQHGLGHASVQTTERYLNTQVDLRAGKAAADYIRIGACV